MLYGANCLGYVKETRDPGGEALRTHKTKVIKCLRFPAVLPEIIKGLPNFAEPSLGFCTPGSSPHQRSALVSLWTPMKERRLLRAGVHVQKPRKYPKISTLEKGVQGAVYRGWQFVGVIR